MKARLINIGLLLSSLICYLEWGGGNASFLFQMEYSIFYQNRSTDSFTHPFVIIPLVGQLLLLASTVMKIPSKRLALIGMLMIGVLILMILLIGIISMNVRIAGSTIPFLVVAIFFIISYRKS